MKRKVIMILGVSFIIMMAALFIFYLIKEDSSRWQVALGGILVSALPMLLLLTKKNPFNMPLIIGYYAFIFCTLVLGSIASFYLKLKWWDSTLHLYKGIFVGLIAIALYKFWLPEQAQKFSSRWILFLFVFSLPLTATVLWEIYEFLGDLFITHTMQRGGNKDTMIDVLAGTAGGLLIAVYATLWKEKILN
ncbi:MAG TPA: hypothetical protein VEY51_10470 [Chondromyces sp.]|nr:hypothetical protein [Chondromyces sp.]